MAATTSASGITATTTSSRAIRFAATERRRRVWTNRGAVRRRSPRFSSAQKSAAGWLFVCSSAAYGLTFQVRVAVQAVFVEANQLPGALVIHASRAHRRFDVGAQLAE